MRELIRDPSSHLFAAGAGWEWPQSREAFLLAELYDRFTQVNFKHPKPYPRPSDRKKRQQAASKPTVSQDVIRAALAARGHTMN